jgi:geranylgeranyl diphosphate synthase type I
MPSISEYREPINTALASFFADLPERLELNLSIQSQEALDMLKEYCLRPGKRVRGSLAAFAHDYATGSEFNASGLQLGVAFELIQSYFLIIDDVMDRSKTRRGKPTIHELYAQSSAPWSGDVHTTNMLAINVGLIAQHLANIVIAELQQEPRHVKELMARVHKNISGTTFGQIDDLVQQIGGTFTREDLLRKYLLKSSYYTYISPLQAGLILAGVDNETVLEEVHDFGVAAGIAFQLHDDYLGVFGESSMTGKSNLDDLQEGKYTLLIHYCLEHCSGADKTLLETEIGKLDLTEERAVVIRGILVKYGAKAYLQAQTSEYASSAIEILHASTYWNDASISELESFVNFTVSRES